MEHCEEYPFTNIGLLVGHSHHRFGSFTGIAYVNENGVIKRITLCKVIDDELIGEEVEVAVDVLDCTPFFKTLCSILYERMEDEAAEDASNYPGREYDANAQDEAA